MQLRPAIINHGLHLRHVNGLAVQYHQAVYIILMKAVAGLHSIEQLQGAADNKQVIHRVDTHCKL